MPFSSGMPMSSSAMSGFSSSACRTASRPSPASATTSQSGRSSRILRMPWRTIVWSSASRMRSCGIYSPCAGWVVRGHRRRPPGTADAAAPAVRRSAASPCRAPFRSSAIPGIPTRAPRCRAGPARACRRRLVAFRDGKPFPSSSTVSSTVLGQALQVDAAGRRLGVPRDVGQRLLDDPVEARFDFARPGARPCGPASDR